MIRVSNNNFYRRIHIPNGVREGFHEGGALELFCYRARDFVAMVRWVGVNKTLHCNHTVTGFGFERPIVSRKQNKSTTRVSNWVPAASTWTVKLELPSALKPASETSTPRGVPSVIGHGFFWWKCYWEGQCEWEITVLILDWDALCWSKTRNLCLALLR